MFKRETAPPTGQVEDCIKANFYSLEAKSPEKVGEKEEEIERVGWLRV